MKKALSVILTLIFSSTLLFSQTSVFINEIHYDNDGADAGEAVEIAGPAGTDLTSWTIALYNGSPTQLNVYATITLSGIIPNTCGGYGTLSFTYAGIQNGSPDGLALVNASSTVVQFLSYEGSFVAASGPASGMTSIDIGVSEPYNTPVGQSLQLTGTGSTYEDFSWSGPAAATFGACNSGQTFTGGSETAPSVSSTTPADATTNIAVDSDIVINFSEDVTINGSWYSIAGASSGSHTAVVSGGPATYTLNPDTDFSEGEAITVTVYAAQVADVDTDDPPDNMAADYVFSFTIVLPVAGLEIHDIQGTGTVSPYDGIVVSTSNNVVTAVGPEGFFIQAPEVSIDADVNTSEGIYVYTAGVPTVSVGDIVNITATVDEYYEFTELVAPSITVTGTGATLPTAVVLDGTTPSSTAPQNVLEFERLEGMLVSITGGVVNGPNQYFSSDPIAEVYITAGSSRVFRETGVEYPGAGGSIPVWDGNPEIFEMDPDKLGLPNMAISGGSTFDATGVIGYEFSGYELWPTSLTVYHATLPAPVSGGGASQYSVGALNMYRLFDEVNDGGEEVVPLAEYDIRLAKLSQYVRNVLQSPHILAVSEVEKLGVLQDLADEITADDGTIVYTPYLEEGNDVGGIDVGFLVQESIVQVDAVTQLGASETWTDPNSGPGTLLHDRPPLLLEGSFKISDTPYLFTPISAMALHIRSLNGIDTDRVRQKRLKQAQSIAQMIQNLQVADPEVNLVVLGDMNAFEFTDGYVDVLGQIRGEVTPSDNLLSGAVITNPVLTNHVTASPTAAAKVLVPLADVGNQYSFIYQGSAQTLDHVLTSSHLTGAVSNQEFARGNADAAIDFASDDTNPLRSSDHDGLVIYINAEDLALPVELGEFTATDVNGNILLQWMTESEIENLGFIIERKIADTDWMIIANYKTAEALLGQGTVSHATDYEYVDALVQHGNTYEYRLADVDYNGVVTYHVTRTVTVQSTTNSTLPDKYALEANYPNPFNPSTTINFNLPEDGLVTIAIYDISGRRVKTIVNQQMSAGFHSTKWNSTDASGKDVGAGIYFYSIQANDFKQTLKMLLFK